MNSCDIKRCCPKCKASCNNEFKQIVNLKSSGLVVFADNSENKIKHTNFGSIVLHNKGHKELKKNNYVAELCQYKTKCYQCQKILRRVRDLLDNIEVIRKHEVLAVCDHCKRSNLKFKCSRCEYMLEKFIARRVQQNECLRDEYAAWWQTVKNTLLTIIDVQNTCPHRVCFVQNSDNELRKLISFLKSPSQPIEPRLYTFPPRKLELPVPVDDDTRNVLLEMINEIGSDKQPYTDSESVLSSCMCRYFDEKKKERMHPKVSLELPVIKEYGTENPQIVAEQKLGLPGTLGVDGDIKTKRIINEKPSKSSKTSGGRKNISTVKKNGKQMNYDDGLAEDNKNNSEELKQKSKDKKFKLDPQYELMLQLIKVHKEKGKLKEGKTKSALQILKKMPHIEPLPELPVPKARTDTDSQISGGTLVCTPIDSLPRVMIRGSQVVSLEQATKSKLPIALEPLLYKRHVQCNTPLESPSESVSSSSSSESITEELNKVMGKGIIKYALSKKEFIEKRWTKLPTTKIMRKMNIYKMEAPEPHFDWFKNHVNRRVMFYDTGEILAEIYENGNGGKWFYKNGAVALHFRNAYGNAKHRYIIYGVNDDDYLNIRNTKRPVTILACFDYLGNGVVYDQYGKARIKYNQSEGVVIDDKIGAPGKWKWHSLNDPPVLQNVYIDNKLRDDTFIEKINIPDDLKVFNKDNVTKEIDEVMLAIEFENFVKSKAEKIMQKMTSYKIRIKAVKINDYFSLRIVDQEKIYILFRNGHVCFKLNIGMHLKSNEIIDTITVEVDDVSTPYDVAPETKSLQDIHEILRCMQI